MNDCPIGEDGFNFQSLEEAENYTPGVCQKLFIAPYEWFIAVKEPQHGIIISEDHEFIDGLAFIEIWLAPDKNSFATKNPGDLGSNIIYQEIYCEIPVIYAEALETLTNLRNIPCIALISDACTSDWYFQLGNNLCFAWLQLDLQTGTTASGSKGFKAKVNYSSTQVWLYQGSIIPYTGGDVENALLDYNSAYIFDSDNNFILTE